MPGIVKVTNSDGTIEELLVTDGFAEMHDSVLSLVCEAGERAAEERARKQLEEATTVDVNLAKAEAALQKALLRQMLARKRSGSGTV